MALFKGNKTDAASTPPRRADDKTAAGAGAHAAECMRVGQLLVDGDNLSSEHLATALQHANGDVLQFSDIVLGRFGTGRNEVATMSNRLAFT